MCARGLLTNKPFGLPSSLLLVQHLSGVVVLLSWS